jgi:xanthine dehydrogenase small subunit
MGTLGGNIANGSPIGDSLPALIALDATLVLRRGNERRRLALEDFFVEYGKQDRRPGEFIEKILVPKLPDGAEFRCYKISKRFDQDISAVCGAFRITVIGGVVRDVRIAFGGMAGTPRRAARAEAALSDKPWSRSTVTDGMTALDEEFTPLTDWRASALYRRTAARNLLLKVFIESASVAPATRLVGAGKVAYA